MKKNFAVGLIAVGLIVAGGTGTYVAFAKEKTLDPKVMMQHPGMETGQMAQMMNSKDMQEMMNSKDMQKMMNSKDLKEMQKIMQNKNFSFNQMLPYMKKMHPDLSDNQLKELFEKMHGKNGVSACSNILKRNNNENRK